MLLITILFNVLFVVLFYFDHLKLLTLIYFEVHSSLLPVLKLKLFHLIIDNGCCETNSKNNCLLSNLPHRHSQDCLQRLHQLLQFIAADPDPFNILSFILGNC